MAADAGKFPVREKAAVLVWSFQRPILFSVHARQTISPIHASAGTPVRETGLQLLLRPGRREERWQHAAPEAAFAVRGSRGPEALGCPAPEQSTTKNWRARKARFGAAAPSRCAARTVVSPGLDVALEADEPPELRNRRAYGKPAPPCVFLTRFAP